MLDIKLIRENPELVRNNLKKRNDPEKLKLLDDLILVDKKWRESQTKLNDLRNGRNQVTLEITKLKKQGKAAAKEIKKTKKNGDGIKQLEVKVEEYQTKEKNLLMGIPNLLHESVPFGKDENDNVEIRKWGKEPKFDFEPKNHLEILENLGMIDFERGAKVAGTGFYYLKGDAVILDLALQRFAIDFLTKQKGFTVIEPPLMINHEAYEGMIDAGDFEMVTYKIDKENLYLIATAEHPVGAMFKDEVFNEDDLPAKFCGLSPCFRKEIGTHGKYTKGLFRVHNFTKVEQFIFSLPEQSWNLLEELQKNSEELYQQLGLHYRVVNICTGDIGSIAAKKYDIEVWMADGKFRELGSNSNCTDYQARRLNIKYREGEGKPLKGFVHTLNNTALATSRTMIAIIEHFQKKDGSVIIPKVLRPYMNGLEKLEKERR